MSRIRCLIGFLALVVSFTPVHAAVVVIANPTDASVTVTIAHPTGTPNTATLAPGEARPFPVGRVAEIRFTANGKAHSYQLDPYTAYVFTKTGFQGIEMAATMPKPEDVPAEPVEPKPLRIVAKLLVDEAQPRTKMAWEKALRKRVEATSALLERQLGVTIEVADVGAWTTAAPADDLPTRLKDFEQQVKPAGGQLMLGFTSRPVASGTHNLGATRGPLHSHVLVSEGTLKTEAEEVELLYHELMHLFGAAHSPDPSSAMRAKLGDGQARSLKFRIGLDPLNLLAVAIWTETLRGGQVKTWADLPPLTRDRLEVIYKTILHALPNDPVATEYLTHLAKVKPEADPKPSTTKRVAAPKEDAIRAVVQGVTRKATELAKLADRPKGDQLTAEYVKVAAAVAATQAEDMRATAFLVGLGIALDDSTVLRKNPVTGKLCEAVESDPERRERIAVLGLPTMRHRRDLCQHFVVSAALAEMQGPALAEAAGLLKELADLDGASGFSFADLAADYAGVAFAQKVKKTPAVLATLAKEFAVADYVPVVTGLREGLSRTRFEADFGSTSDPRLLNALEEARARVIELPAYKK